jgi:hypothetical protein
MGDANHLQQVRHFVMVSTTSSVALLQGVGAERILATNLIFIGSGERDAGAIVPGDFVPLFDECVERRRRVTREVLRHRDVGSQRGDNTSIEFGGLFRPEGVGAADERQRRTAAKPPSSVGAHHGNRALAAKPDLQDAMKPPLTTPPITKS